MVTLTCGCVRAVASTQDWRSEPSWVLVVFAAILVVFASVVYVFGAWLADRIYRELERAEGIPFRRVTLRKPPPTGLSNVSVVATVMVIIGFVQGWRRVAEDPTPASLIVCGAICLVAGGIGLASLLGARRCAEGIRGRLSSTPHLAPSSNRFRVAGVAYLVFAGALALLIVNAY